MYVGAGYFHLVSANWSFQMVPSSFQSDPNSPPIWSLALTKRYPNGSQSNWSASLFRVIQIVHPTGPQLLPRVIQMVPTPTGPRLLPGDTQMVPNPSGPRLLPRDTQMVPTPTGPRLLPRDTQMVPNPTGPWLLPRVIPK